MPKIYDKRENAVVHKVKENDTLEAIAKKHPHIESWMELASYNFGTHLPREVHRALLETVGCKEIDPNNPGKTTLKPFEGAKAEILVPKFWKQEGFEVKKKHLIKVKRFLPATAISIIHLDKWFIPGVEECEIKYALGGLKQCADKVELEIYGSNYCKCTDWSKGLGKYEALADTPVFKKLTDNKADQYGMHDVETEHEGKKGHWRGQCNAEQGILSEKTGGKARVVNVAFSPYTVHFRYYKDEADKKARLVLEPFWPQWDETPEQMPLTQEVEASQITLKWNHKKEDPGQRGVCTIKDKAGQRVYLTHLPKAKLAKGGQEVVWDKKYRADAESSKFTREYVPADGPYAYDVTLIFAQPKVDSLKVKWEIKDTTRLESGLLLITDGTDKTVFSKPLAKTDLSQGKHELAWDGKYSPGIKNSKGGDKVISEDMPYRVQVQGHTVPNQEKGLALAAMHTEVRLYVRPQTHVPKDICYDPWVAGNSLTLGLGRLVPGDPPAEDAGTKWYRYKLAEYGFHPGPVTDAGAADPEYKLALKEFKRSVPADGSASAPNFTRLALDGGKDEQENDETKTAIKNIRASDKRRWFGSRALVLASSDAPDLTDEETRAMLPDPSQDVIVWVDDRQYYSAGSTKDDQGNDFFTGEPGGSAADKTAAKAFGLLNHRGEMDIADAKTTRDGESIPRPWLPLQVDLPLVGKAAGLQQEANSAPSDDLRTAMQRAIGPIRVDWTFDELPSDFSTIDTAYYDPKFTRSRKYLAWALSKNKGEHTRKDTGRKAVYMNCKETFGGLRPDSLASYYEKAFGAGDLSLAPWVATAVSDTESIATVVHDHLAASQVEKTDLFKPLLGRAGAFFHPSRVAGDGYRVRAEVQFSKFTGYDFPNLEVLKARYPAPPQAHTSRLRLWRRSSVRGYMCWSAAATGHWPGLLNGLRASYRAAHVYFVHDGTTAARSFNVTDVFDPGTPAHVTRYKNTVSNNVPAFLQDTAKMSLKGGFIWPWSDQNNFGYPRLSPVDLTPDKVYDKFIMGPIMNTTWRSFRIGLLLALVRQVERNGILRGHLFVEFDSSPAFVVQKYLCDGTPAHTYWALEKPGAADRPDEPCPAVGCTGTLKATGSIRNYDSMPCPAVGGALGATWLFTSSDADTWTHEVGHHRHLEHAASAPGAQYDPDATAPNTELHDSQDNTTQNWVTLGVTKTAEQDWDRNCIMSYASVYYAGGVDYFCGKCLLRNRGWRVQTLTYPGTDVKEP